MSHMCMSRNIVGDDIDNRRDRERGLPTNIAYKAKLKRRRRKVTSSEAEETLRSAW